MEQVIDPDLVTVKGRNVIEKADVIVYAGSLVNKEVLNPRKEDCVVYNSAVLNLEETTEICREATSKGQLVARVHTETLPFMELSVSKSESCKNMILNMILFRE